MKNSRFIGDPIVTEIVRNAFISAAKEMNETLYRSSYSPIIYESKDCAAGLFDVNADALGLSVGVPMFLGNLEVTIEATTEHIGGIENYNEGDVYIINDSYKTGAHLNDMTLLSPIFYNEELVGFTANRAHWLDIGSKDPGYPLDSTEIFQEGIRIPPIKIMDKGVFQKNLAEMICKNTRFFRSAMGDLNAQIAACKTGEKRYVEILKKFGYKNVKDSIHDIFLQSEIMEKEIVSNFKNGVYNAVGYLDNDGTVMEPIKVNVTITIEDGNMTVDLTGSSPTAKGSTNCGFAQTISATRMAFKMIVAPDAPVTGGSFRHIDIKAPRNTIFTAEEPAACAWYFSSLGLLIDLVAKALEDVAPEKVSAAHYGDSMVIYLSGNDHRKNQDYLYVEATVGGWGAYKEDDGANALINVSNGAYKNIPVEVFEDNYPVRINKFELRKNSGGPGKNRGGLGIIKEFEVLNDESNLYLWFERSVTPAWGIKNGKAGAKPNVVVRNGEQEKRMLKVNAHPMKKTDVAVIYTGGGGGYGNPLERDVEQVKKDYLLGYIDLEHAKNEYGVVMDFSGNIDMAKTKEIRSTQ
jgi:N-methylhydantoinase B